MMFPIKNDLEIKSIPWAVLKPHELQALRNHAQGLDRLASKGGVTPCEAVAIIEGLLWHRMPFSEARDTLMGYVRKAMGSINFREPGEFGEGATLRVEPTDIKRDPIREALELVRNMRDGRAGNTRYNFNKLEILLERAL